MKKCKGFLCIRITANNDGYCDKCYLRKEEFDLEWWLGDLRGN